MKLTPFIFSIFLLTVSCSATAQQQPDVRLIEGTYIRLKSAINFQNLRYPLVQIIEKEKINGASYDADLNVIFIERVLLDICKEMGALKEDALAIVLAHELTHFYQKHKWNKNPKACFLLEKKLSYKYKEINHEKEADIHGALNAYLAGYNVRKTLPLLYQNIYATYGLDDKLDGYPLLEKRLETPDLILKEVEGLIQLFESSNYFLSMGYFRKALLGFRYIIEEVGFESVSLYNNMALAYTLGSFEFLADEENRFAYPIELDWDSRLNQPLFRSDEEAKQFYLFKATQYLEKALSFSNDNIHSTLNLLCVKELLGKQKEVLTLIEEIKPKVRQKSMQANLDLLKGITLARIGKKKAAKNLFEKLRLENPFQEKLQEYIKLNLLALSKHTPKTQTTNTFDKIKREDQIDGIDLNRIAVKNHFSNFYYLSSTTSTEESKTDEYFYFLKTDDYFLSTFSENKNTSSLQVITNSEMTTKRKIGIGSPSQKVFEVYSEYPHLFSSFAKGYLIQFPALGLIFKINAEGFVEEWACFET